MTNYFYKFLALLLLFASSCARPTQEELAIPEEMRKAPLQIDVFSARAFLGGSDYERYYSTGDVLWRECGHVVPSFSEQPLPRSMEGDKVFPEDPSLTIVQRRVEKLSSEQENRLKARAAALVVARATSDEKNPPPGSVFSISDPGMLELNISFGPRKLNMVTSVDAVADKDSATLESIYSLFAYLRGLGPTICDAETFYGIPRSSQ